MTLLFTDGFNDLLPEKWSTVAGISVTSLGRHGNGANVTSAGINLSRSVVFPAREAVVFGVALRRTERFDSVNTTPQGVRFTTGSTNRHLIGPNVDTGVLQIRAGTHSATVLANGPVIPMDTWVYLEVKIVLGTSGSLEARLDGETVIDMSDINLGTALYDKFELVSLSSIGAMRVDDIYLLDTLGAENNDFLGDVEVRTILPSGAGSRTQMINADETQVDNFSYVNTPGDEEGFVEGGAGVGDLYEMDNIDAGQIHGVIQYHKSKMSDTGVQKARHLTRYDNVDYEGPDANLGFSYNAFKRIWEKAPDDTEWTPAKLNATEMGVEGRG